MLEIIKFIVICFVISDMAMFVGELIDRGIIVKNKILDFIKLTICYILSCPKCFSFWTTLIFTQNILYAAIVAFTVELLKKLYNKNNITKL